MKLRIAASLVSMLVAPVAVGRAPAGAAPDGEVAIGPWGTSIGAVEIDPAAPEQVLVGSSSVGGVVLTGTDGVFALAAASDYMGSVDLIVRDPDTPGRFVAVGAGLFESVDGGASWTALPPLGDSVKELAASPFASSWLSASFSTVYRSIDDGSTWSVVLDGLSTPAVTWSSTEPGVAFVGTAQGALKSTDGGATFFDPSPDATDVDIVLTDPVSPGVVYIATTDGAVLRSDDGGVSYAALPVPATTRLNFLVSDPNAIGRIWLGLDDAVAYSDDGGHTWTDESAGIPEIATQPWPFDLAFRPNGDKYLALFGDGGGLLRMSAGESEWLEVGIPSEGPTGVAVTEPGGKRILVSPFGASVSDGPFAAVDEDALSPLAATTIDASSTVMVDRTDPDRWIFGGLEESLLIGKIAVLENGGQDVAASEVIGEFGNILDLVQDPNDPTRMLAANGSGFSSGGVLVSTDSGADWFAVQSTVGLSLNSVDIDPFDSSHWLACVGQGIDGSVIYESIDDGQTIGVIHTMAGAGYPRTIRFDPHHEDVVYCITLGGLWRSDDAGQSWTSIAAGSGLYPDIEFHPTVPGTLWYGDDEGDLLLSGDGGQTFTTVWSSLFGAGTNHGYVSGIALDTATDTVVVAVYGEGGYEVFDANPFAVLGGGSGELELLPTGGLPRLGNDAFELTVQGAAPGTASLIYAGLADLDLAFLGGTLHTGPPWVLEVAGVTDSEGAFAVGVPIPAAPVLQGIRLFGQGFALDPGAVGGIALSDALGILLMP